MSISGSWGYTQLNFSGSIDDEKWEKAFHYQDGEEEILINKIKYDELRESLTRAGDLIAELRKGIIYVENVRDKLLVENKALRHQVSELEQLYEETIEERESAISYGFKMDKNEDLLKSIIVKLVYCNTPDAKPMTSEEETILAKIIVNDFPTVKAMNKA